jgi:glyoxylase-like metal-dependent hydrolase (beta-lactamase superfamily II)
MINYICTTCGTQFNAAESEPEHCPICEDERQYVNHAGQQWTTISELQVAYKPVFQKKEADLYGIGMAPHFAITQRALLVTSPQMNVLWDCISLVDEAIIDFINGLGGLDGIAISHPHYYTSMIEWSRAFGDVPVYLHEKDKEWVQRESENIIFWTGDSLKLTNQISLHNAGGHFEGGTVLHWSEGAGGKGVLLGGDIIAPVADRRHVTFMYSFPNYIPLNKAAVERIVSLVEPLEYDRIYGAFGERNIISGAKQAVAQSAKRYIKAIG